MPWLDEHEPFERDRSDAQIAGLLKLLGSGGCRVLDLGCGTGRVCVPLANAGHDVVAVDRDKQALSFVQSADHAPGSIKAIAADFMDTGRLTSLGGRFDAILCLGNTLMTLVDVDEVLALFQTLESMLLRSGCVVIDDIPGDFWPEVVEGYWQNGVSEDDDMQMVWEHDDAVFAIRSGDAVDPAQRDLTKSDRRFRLWTMGDLRLLGSAAGLSGIDVDRACGLIVFRKQT